MGTSTRRAKASGTRSAWPCSTSKRPARAASIAVATCISSCTLASSVGSSLSAAGAVWTSRAAVREPAAANSVTSCPAATRASVSVEATCSHGP